MTKLESGVAPVPTGLGVLVNNDERTFDATLDPDSWLLLPGEVKFQTHVADPVTLSVGFQYDPFHRVLGIGDHFDVRYSIKINEEEYTVVSEVPVPPGRDVFDVFHMTSPVDGEAVLTAAIRSPVRIRVSRSTLQTTQHRVAPAPEPIKAKTENYYEVDPKKPGAYVMQCFCKKGHVINQGSNVINCDCGRRYQINKDGRDIALLEIDDA